MNPFTGDSTWSLGTLVWLPLLAVLVLALLGFAAFAWKEGEGGMALGSVGTAFVFIVATALPGIGMYPYDAEYHQWRTVSGPVERVDKRLLRDGDGMSERYVLTVGGLPFGVDDTRAATVEVGDTVTLACKREWQYASVSGYGCRWAGESR